MKIFQILDGICYYDATPVHPTLADTIGKYPPDVQFVEAPDYVFENWGYDSTKSGDERFIKPTPPDGWYYDDETGSFQPINPPEPPEPEPEPETAESVLADATTAYEEGVNEA